MHDVHCFHVAQLSMNIINNKGENTSLCLTPVSISNQLLSRSRPRTLLQLWEYKLFITLINFGGMLQPSSFRTFRKVPLLTLSKAFSKSINSANFSLFHSQLFSNIILMVKTRSTVPRFSLKPC